VRIAKPELEDAFRRRALAMAPVAGAAALAGLVVVRSDAPRIWDGLTGGAGLAAVILSALAGAATISFVLARRYGFARVTAATAVAAIIAGWGLAQRPRLLPGLTIEQGAADRSVIIATLVALALGSLILVPSLGLLYSLLLSGRFDDQPEPARAAEAAAAAGGSPRASHLLPAALSCLAIGVLATVPVSSNWGRIVGVPFLLAFVALGFAALATALTAEDAT
jgi:cytochrome d ubiquinol oxidase subunit II